ncbi:flagellar hook-basal body complex protein FliE [Botrimarina hoheduenensis]|uniref:Flagellar hook-basal body complex protein FliE n=1 Tax=Botrimarina hoheduenensis TaxID=2528000 RepID=A0A5C5VZG3_9BACT|nr:flagellar hook-basal body complex protein FliE [Botrimarina hoheduenensis]TWT43179.1 flagellar hook-basal body protein FliE [Botrimarina hoheduenensis]
MNLINPANGPQVLGVSAQSLAAGNKPDATAGGAFREMLAGSLESVNSMQQQADQAIETLFTGGDIDPAEVLTAVQKADMAFRMTMQVRNKLMDVYREIQEVRI